MLEVPMIRLEKVSRSVAAKQPTSQVLRRAEAPESCRRRSSTTAGRCALMGRLGRDSPPSRACPLRLGVPDDTMVSRTAGEK